MVIKPEDVKPQTLFTELRPEWMQSDDESEFEPVKAIPAHEVGAIIKS